MQCTFESPGPFVNPEAMAAAASLVNRDYGLTGYSLAVAGGNYIVGVFEVAHFDGSRFNVAADRWGNAERLPDGDPDAHVALRAFQARATEV